MKIVSKKGELGVTIIELMVAVSISSVLLLVVALFMTRALDISKEEVEQGRINEVARIQMERMSDIIRAASNVDIDGDGEYDGGVERWIETATEEMIVVWTDADGDGDVERVTYNLDGTDLLLKREGIDVAYNIVAVDVRNIFQPSPVPLFEYYSVGGGNAVLVDPAIAGLDAIDKVGINLVVDADENQPPEAGVFRTVVTPSRGQLSVHDN